jgi:AcrR family transcriptional regulator
MRNTVGRGQALRDVSRAAIRAHVARVGIDLFDERGVENVTVDQIATAAGISIRSFHRYFAAKEDVVVGDPAKLGELVRGALIARPAAEPAWTSLRLAYLTMLQQAGDDEQLGKRTIRVMTTTAALRARNLEKHLLWAQLLTPIIQDRIADSGGLEAETVVQASLACLDVSLTRWARSDDDPLADVLERSFAAVYALHG